MTPSRQLNKFFLLGHSVMPNSSSRVYRSLLFFAFIWKTLNTHIEISKLSSKVEILWDWWSSFIMVWPHWMFQVAPRKVHFLEYLVCSEGCWLEQSVFESYDSPWLYLNLSTSYDVKTVCLCVCPQAHAQWNFSFFRELHLCVYGEEGPLIIPTV